MASTSPLRQRLATANARVRAHLLLETAERAVRARSPEQQALVRSYSEAAGRRCLIADELGDERGAVAALVLYREAVALLAAAIAFAIDPGARELDATETQPLATLERLAHAGALPPLPKDVEEAVRFLGQTRALGFDELAPDELFRRHQACSSAARWLRARVEARSLPEIRASRALRVGAGVLAAIAVLGWVAAHLVQSRNLALHKPVTASSRHAQSTAPLDNSGLVNGVIESSYGVHTAPQPGWVMVDLLAVRKLSQVRVYNRADGWADASLPLTLELSQDGRAFVPVATRTTLFSSADPWVFDAHGARARYIRVRSNTFIALTELEAYAAD